MCVCVCVVCVCVCVSVCVCVFMCPPPRLLIPIGVMWCDIDSKRLVKQVPWLLLEAVVSIVSGHDVSIHTHHEN